MVSVFKCCLYYEGQQCYIPRHPKENMKQKHGLVAKTLQLSDLGSHLIELNSVASCKKKNKQESNHLTQLPPSQAHFGHRRHWPTPKVSPSTTTCNCSSHLALPMLCLCKFSDSSVRKGHVIVSVSVLLLVSVSTVLRPKVMVERSGIQTLGGGTVDGGAKERDVVEHGGSRRLTLPERASRWGGCNPPLPKTLTCYAMLCNILHKTAIQQGIFWTRKRKRI